MSGSFNFAGMMTRTGHLGIMTDGTTVYLSTDLQSDHERRIVGLKEDPAFVPDISLSLRMFIRKRDHRLQLTTYHQIVLGRLIEAPSKKLGASLPVACGFRDY